MIEHRLFTKGEYVQALISTTQQPNVLIPVRALVYDVKFDDINPQYQIRVKKFYDSIYFLKKHMFGGRFIKDFEGHDTRINLNREQFTTKEQLENDVFNGPNWKKYLLVVDSVFCVKTKNEQTELFNSLQDFMIQVKLKEIFELANRYPYKEGQFYYQSKGEYIAGLKKFLADRYPTDKNWEEDLLYRPDSSEMDGAEWI